MLEGFFQPRSVAVIGASRSPGKVGHDLVRNLIEGGYQGKIYPVNPKAEEILGLKCYPDVLAIEGQVGLAVVVLPAGAVLGVIDQCGEKGIGSVIVISAGFKESGEEGARLEKELAGKCRAGGIRCIGPNCLGVISPPAKMNASFAAAMPKAGNIAFLSQSGALGTAVLDIAIGEGLGISRFISYGNKVDVNETDLLEALGEDEQTAVILAYLESVEDGQRFMDVARKVTREKPVVVLKGGRTSAGARAASSHTGSLAGSDSAYEAAFKQCGILRAEGVSEFLALASAFSSQKPPPGGRVAVVTNAGGPGILATDAIESSSLTMAELTEQTVQSLSEGLPATANLENPIDVLGDASADRYRLALTAAAEDRNVDAMLALLTPQTSTEDDKTAEAIAEVARGTAKSVLAAFMGARSLRNGLDILQQKGVPNFSSPEGAVKTLEGMFRYGQWQRRRAREVRRFELDTESIGLVLRGASERGLATLGERRSQRIAAACGIAVPRSVLAADAEQAARSAQELGYPVVLKIASEGILHKSDAGGVRVGLRDAREVREAFGQILESARAYNPQARVDGVLVQEMVRGGREVIVGLSRDPQFGPMIMFGLGGIYVELLKDVAFRIAPLTPDDAGEMIDEIRAARVLKGFRGQPPADIGALTECILKVSQLAAEFPELAECDLNPLMVFEEGRGVMAIDVRFGLR